MLYKIGGEFNSVIAQNFLPIINFSIATEECIIIPRQICSGDINPLVFTKIIFQKRITLGWTSHSIHELCARLYYSTCQDYGIYKNTPAEQHPSRCISCGTLVHVQHMKNIYR